MCPVIGWAQSINMPTISQPVMIIPQMPAFPQLNFQPSGNVFNGSMPVLFTFSEIKMPSFQFPNISMPNFSGFFGEGQNIVNPITTTQSVFSNLKFPENKNQPVIIDPFRRNDPAKIMSNIVPSGNLPGSINHKELSLHEMARMGFQPKSSKLEAEFVAQKSQLSVLLSWTN